VGKVPKRVTTLQVRLCFSCLYRRGLPAISEPAYYAQRSLCCAGQHLCGTWPDRDIPGRTSAHPEKVMSSLAPKDVQ